MRYVLLFLLLCSCKIRYNEKNASIKRVDSFYLYGINDLNDVINLDYVNDSTFYSFNFNSNGFKKFSKSGEKKFKYVYEKKIKIDTLIESFCILNSNKLLLIDYENSHYLFDTSMRIHKLHIQDIKEHLGKNYINCNLKYHPIRFHNNEFWSIYYFMHLDSYTQYFQEPSLCEYEIKQDSIFKVNSFIDKPRDLINYESPYPIFCDNGDSIVLVYPCFDSLYIVNKTTKALSKMIIGNLSYKLPAPWDYNQLFADTFNAYKTRYELKNFKYQAIIFNPNTRHYLLFYLEPSIDAYSQPLKLLVLNNKFETIDYYTFNENFFHITNIVVIPNKGIALPIFPKDPEHEKNILYYIYNF
jgi:hypothetical protein